MFIHHSKLINDSDPNSEIIQNTAILVPVASYIEPSCEYSLRQLEHDGVKVYRQYGFSAIDQGRCVMAQIAINDGYKHLFWIDSDISFYWRDVYKVINRNRNNEYPFITGAYSVKGWPILTTKFFDEDEKIPFGEDNGGLQHVKWAATGFMYTHRTVYENIKLQYNLKKYKIWGGQYIVYPWFFPMLLDDQYVGEDFSFCERANHSGIKIFCDTTVELAHIGKYSYSYNYLLRKAPEERIKNIDYYPHEENFRALKSNNNEQFN